MPGLHDNLWPACDRRATASTALPRTYLVRVGDTVLPGVEDDKLVGLRVGVHDRLQVFFVFFAAFVVGTHQWLAATGNRCLTFWMDPRQNLAFGSNKH